MRMSRAALHRRTRVVAVLSLAVLLPLLPAGPSWAERGEDGSTASPTPTPGQSDVDRTRQLITEAEGRVAGMQAQVEQTMQVLQEETGRLEQGQAELVRMRAEQAGARRVADDAVEQADAAKNRLGTVVSAALRSPVPDRMQLALTTGPEGFRDAVVARADLDRVRGTSQDTLRNAKGERVRADDLVRRAEQLTEAAAERERQLAEQVEKVRTIATDTERQLQEGVDALGAARTAHQGALDEAAARAAAQARDVAAAEAAAALAREYAVSNSALLATCTDQTTSGQANGYLSPGTLCPLDDAPGQALRADAAAAFNALNAAHKAERGTPLCVTDSYRSYGGQVAVYAAKPQLAAVPGRSNHGWGVAVDFGCGVQQFGSDAHLWMRANAVRFGWYHPSWAQASGSRPEAWHWEFAGAR